MKIQQIHKYLTNLFPLNKQEKWDQSGLYKFSNLYKPVNNILICLDITNKVVQTAIKNKIDLIISHHPIFLNSKEIETNKYEFKLISMIKKHRIGLVSYHTNIDNNKYGLNYFISSLISNNIKYIKKTPLYRIKGVFNLTKLKKIFKKFTCNTFKYVGNQKTFKSLVLCSGAGFSVLKQNINKLNKEDLWITGDVKWHDFIFCKENKINILDVGHNLENMFVDLIFNLLKIKFKNLKLIKLYSSIS